MRHTDIRWKLLLVLLCCLLLTACGGSMQGADSQEMSGRREDIPLSDIPEYTGEPYIAVDGNEPDFSEEERTANTFESYSELDSLGRCGAAYACIGRDLMPAEERGSIGQVKPTGWQTVKYENVDGKYLYNRCHLIGYQLTGENANEKNLITGTRYMNVDGMLPFENMVADYVKETGNHVLYRVTPVFEEDDLLASGVQMEALSVEDEGADISYNVFVYNVQPGISIDYATGDSAVSESELSGAQTEEGVIRGNSRSKIYHCPGQAAYEEMADSKNLVIFGSEQEAEAAGYRKAMR
ncbi:MAG: DNA/RNA non-specific endonuclease [Dorea sp.]|jgi:DNA-entry nuclease|nr:DNA/RNA non-specific endonuclease [Dorea sp.]